MIISPANTIFPVVLLTSEIVALAPLLACVNHCPADALTSVFPVILTVMLLVIVPNCQTLLAFNTLIISPGSKYACV